MKRGFSLDMLGCGTAMAAALLVSFPALAQDDAGASSPGVGEIVVTAQKRAQAINDVGMSITAVTGEGLASRGITAAEDLMKAVPGFTYQETALGNPVYTLRGVGFIDQSLGASPAVSVYVDEVPLPFAIMAKGASLDLDRLEVLKGPQGTLYGQNSTGGAFNYIAAKPTNDFAFGMDGSYGRFDMMDLGGFVSGPLSDTIRARLAVKTEQGGDWQYSVTRPNQSHGRTEKYNGRLTLDFEPADGTKFTLGATGWIDKSDTTAPQLAHISPQILASLNPDILNYPRSTGSARQADWSPGTNYARDDWFWQLSLRADQDLSDALTLTSITAYQKFSTRANYDNDGMDFHDGDRAQRGTISAFSQELRLAGDMGALNWLIGGNYGKYKTDEYFIYTLGDASNTEIAGMFFDRASAYSRNNIETYGLFANAEYEVVPDLTIQAGIRYTNTKRDYAGCGKDLGDGKLADIFNYLGGLFSGGALDPQIQPGQCYTLGLPEDNFVAPQPFRTTLKEDNISWRVGANYKLPGGTLLYANVSKGYKAGSAPTFSASSVISLLPITEESVLAYEGGIKAPLLGRRLQLNAAGFYYDYKDKQLTGLITDVTFGQIQQLVNIPRSYVAGGELELVANPVDGLTFNVAGTYLKTKILEYTGINFGGVNANFRGAEFPLVPKWQVASDVQYDFPISGNLDAFVGGNLTYHSKTSAVFGDTAAGQYDVDSYALLDLRAGISSPDNGWRISVWGRNITNKYYWLTAERSQDVIIRYAGRPVTYGVSFSYRM
ncbi:MAG: TonB-dependent receptor [Sphingobium sp.]